SSVMLRRDCLRDVGLFDETLVGNEDYNLYLRLARNFPFQYIDKILVQIRSHGRNLSDDLEQMEQDEIKNLEKITNMFPDPPIPQRIVKASLYLRFGKYYISQQKFEAARARLRTAIRHSPFLKQAWFLLAVSSLPAGLRSYMFTVNKLIKNAIGK